MDFDTLDMGRLRGLAGNKWQRYGDEVIPAKPKYPDWSFDREVCKSGGDGSKRSRDARALVMGTTKVDAEEVVA